MHESINSGLGYLVTLQILGFQKKTLWSPEISTTKYVYWRTIRVRLTTLFHNSLHKEHSDGAQVRLRKDLEIPLSLGIGSIDLYTMTVTRTTRVTRVTRVIIMSTIGYKT